MQNQRVILAALPPFLGSMPLLGQGLTGQISSTRLWVALIACLNQALITELGFGNPSLCTICTTG
jgi:hypothetical protein